MSEVNFPYVISTYNDKLSDIAEANAEAYRINEYSKILDLATLKKSPWQKVIQL